MAVGLSAATSYWAQETSGGRCVIVESQFLQVDVREREVGRGD